jgi:hypothetical protein
VAGVRGGQVMARCRHRWTTIPQRHVKAMQALGHRLPDAYVGSTVAPWCVKCDAKKGEAAQAEVLRRVVASQPWPDPPLINRPNGRKKVLADLDPLTTLTAEWLADERPAWETVDGFERDVERVLTGCLA